MATDVAHMKSIINEPIEFNEKLFHLALNQTAIQNAVNSAVIARYI